VRRAPAAHRDRNVLHAEARGELTLDHAAVFTPAQIDDERDTERGKSAEAVGIRLTTAQQQFVEIIKAVTVKNAKIVIMDEPTSSLIKEETDKLFEIIRELKKRGISVIYISHRLDEVTDIADRISVFRDGKNRGTLERGEFDRTRIITLMVGHAVESAAKPTITRQRIVFEIKSLSIRKRIKDFNLKLYEGEILGIAGLRGSGKSELFNGLFGTYGNAVRGSARLDGRPFRIASPKHSIKQGLALQTNDRKETGLVPGMNIIRNITLSSLKAFSPGGWLRYNEEIKAARKQMKEMGIKASSPEQEVKTLSGGNQQKVVLAKWLVTQPRVLLLDEPTLGVDVGAKHDIYALMNDLTAQGLAILLVTSELPELLAMSDRIIALHRGRVQAEFSRAEATQENVIQAAMGERSN